MTQESCRIHWNTKGDHVEQVKKNRLSNAFSDLKQAVQYRKDSKAGKYSIDSYLDMIGMFSDKLILEARQEKLRFINGSCTVLSDDRFQNLYFKVELYFENADDEKIVKEFSTEKSTDLFVKETIELFKDKTVLLYEIEEPKGE